MPISLNLFYDAGLTDPVTDLQALQDPDDTLPPVEHHLYLGSPDDDIAYYPDGGYNIILSVASSGSGEPTTAITLALDQAALDTNTPGDDLVIGELVMGGTSHAVDIWVRIDSASATAGRFLNLSLAMSNVVEGYPPV